MSTLRTDNIRTLDDTLNIPLTSIALKSELNAATISVVPTGGISQTDVQAALAGLDTRVTARQPIDATLTGLAGVTTAADTLIYATGVDAFSTAPLTPFARTLLDDTSAAAMRTTLGTNALVLATSQATTSGTSFDFTSIPSGVKRVSIILNSVSTNGTSLLQVQLGAGSVDVATYQGTVVGGTAGNVLSGGTSTTGFTVTNFVTAATSTTAIMTLVNISGNIWIATGTAANTGGNTMVMISGVKTLSGVLDRVRLTTVNGTDLFDGGSVNILYEG